MTASFVRIVPALFVLVGCSLAPEPDRLAASGTFAGATPDGRPLVLVIEQDGSSVSGHGTIDGEPVALAGTRTWTAAATVLRAGGTFDRHSLALAPDGGTLFFTAADTDTLLLRTGPASPAAGGPFAGRYRPPGPEAAWARITLTQNGPLIAGTGVLLGQPVGITARAVSDVEAEGIVIFADDSQSRFAAELAADGRTVVVRGFGGPITLSRF